MRVFKLFIPSSIVVIEKERVFRIYLEHNITDPTDDKKPHKKYTTEHDDVLKVNGKSLEARNYLSIVCVSERRCSSTISLMANTRDVPKCYIYINRITTLRHTYM